MGKINLMVALVNATESMKGKFTQAQNHIESVPLNNDSTYRKVLGVKTLCQPPIAMMIAENVSIPKFHLHWQAKSNRKNSQRKIDFVNRRCILVHT